MAVEDHLNIALVAVQSTVKSSIQDLSGYPCVPEEGLCGFLYWDGGSFQWNPYDTLKPPLGPFLGLRVVSAQIL